MRNADDVTIDQPTVPDLAVSRKDE